MGIDDKINNKMEDLGGKAKEGVGTRDRRRGAPGAGRGRPGQVRPEAGRREGQGRLQELTLAASGRGRRTGATGIRSRPFRSVPSVRPAELPRVSLAGVAAARVAGPARIRAGEPTARWASLAAAGRTTTGSPERPISSTDGCPGCTASTVASTRAAACRRCTSRSCSGWTSATTVPVRAGARGAAGAVQVVLVVVRRVEVDDQVDVVDVDAAGGDVGGDEHAGAARGERRRARAGAAP